MEHEQLPYKERVIDICACGAPLYPVLDKNGKRIGVTHETLEDEDYHFQFFASLHIRTIEGD